jgi:signal transduction histidine kinase
MKRKLTALSRRYILVLKRHLYKAAPRSFEEAWSLGRRAVVLGLETLELARIHEQALVILKLAPGKNSQIRPATDFFSEALAPILETHRAARKRRTDLKRLNGSLKRRTAELAATNRRLQQGIARRKDVQAALKQSSENYGHLLKESQQLQKGLRQLTHQLLSGQEDERKRMSRELQDEIAQTLLGINVRLMSLKQESRNKTKGFSKKISGTQRLVVKSAQAVRRAAREMRKA